MMIRSICNLLIVFLLVEVTFSNNDPNVETRVIGKLIGISHNVTSDNIHIINENKIFIPNLNYDGYSLDAHFYMGTGELPNKHGVLIPDESYTAERLKSYHDANITLEIPTDLKFYEYDWFGIYCESNDENIAYVMLNTENNVSTTEAEPLQNQPKLRHPDIIRILPEFSRLAHGLRSGNITILNNTTFYIPDLHYDGKGPDAHFWVGTGPEPSEDGTLVPWQNYSTATLPAFNGDNVTVVLPDGMTIDDIEWLGIWCIKFKHNFGFVRLRPTSPRIYNTHAEVKVLSEFSRLAHSLKSGNISIINENTILIPNLYYDGKGPDAHFWIGTGPEPTENGKPVPFMNYNDNLPAFNGEDITLTLPEGVTVDDIDWLGVWCIEYKHNFGFTMLHPEERPKSILLNPFNGLKHNLSSGAILILDARTFYIMNLHYDGKGPDAHFWAGKGSNGPPDGGFLVPNEKNSSASISKYSGENIYIVLPEGKTVYDIDYLGLYCIEYNQNFGFTKIPARDEMSSLPQSLGYQQIKNGKKVVRPAKCCNFGYVLQPKGCIRKSLVPFKPEETIKVLDSNLTAFDNDTFVDAVFEPYYKMLDCKKYMLYPEEYSFILTERIIGVEGLDKANGEYCFENAMNEEDEWEISVFACTMDSAHTPDFVFKLYASCLVISVISLILTSLIFGCVKAARQSRGYNVLGYSASMAAAFIILATAQLSKLEGDACRIFGFAFQCFLSSAFIWLNLLMFDIFYRVRYFKDGYNKVRYKWYIGIGILTPLVVLIISILTSAPYLKPKLGHNSCWLRSTEKVFYYYIPILTLIGSAVVLCSFTKREIMKRDAEIDNKNWTKYGMKICKNIFRSYVWLLGVMSICWFAELVSYFQGESLNGFWLALDIIEGLQGVMVLFLIILHDPVKLSLIQQWNLKKEKFKNRNILRAAEETPMNQRPANQRPNTIHSNILINLTRAESVENLYDV